jgi:hypothetical protein
MTSRWLARLAFSFFVVAAVLAWEAWKLAAHAVPGEPRWRAFLYVAAAVLSTGLGVVGTRHRHRRLRDFPDESPDR